MITIGADVEGVLMSNQETPVSAVGLIGGDKTFPFIVDKGNLQEDNVLAEFAIDPVTNRIDFIEAISSVIDSMKAKIEPMELTYTFPASAEFPEDQLNTPQAQMFGCEPDYNAWTGSRNRPPRPSDIGSLRTCGGHIHVGYEFDPDNSSDQTDLIQWMDLYLGLPSVLLDPDTTRRQVYGKAGAFRPKPYGVEYRVLSNFWTQSEELMGWVFDQTLLAYEGFLGGSVSGIFSSRDLEAIRRAITEGDGAVAETYCNIVGVRFPL